MFQSASTPHFSTSASVAFCLAIGTSLGAGGGGRFFRVSGSPRQASGQEPPELEIGPRGRRAVSVIPAPRQVPLKVAVIRGPDQQNFPVAGTDRMLGRQPVFRGVALLAGTLVP